MKTKFGKSFVTYFFPVGDKVRKIVRDWVVYLQEGLLFGNEDPIFPKTQVKQGAARTFEPVGVERQHWSNATPIRKVFKTAFESVDLPYFNPHSFRNTLAQFGEKVCMTPEQFKAWSQNLGHEKVMTTFTSYGEVECHRQGEIIHDLAKPQKSIKHENEEL